MTTTATTDNPSSSSAATSGFVTDLDLIAQYKRRRTVAALIVLGAVLALVIAGGVLVPEFLSPSNLLSVLRAASITGVVAIGLTFVTISGNYFSLSVAQTAILSTVVYATVASSGGFVAGLLAVIAVCVGIGLVQGLVVAAGGNPIVVTLATGAVLLAIVLVVTGGKRVRLVPPEGDSLALFGQSAPLGIPVATWAFVLLAIVCHLLLKKTTLGRQTVLLGANKDTARSIGYNVRWVIAIVFLVAALTAGFAGVLTAAEFGVADASQFTSLDVDAIAAVLVGGTAIRGGQGSILQTTIGVVFIALLNNLLQILGLSAGIRLSLVGGAVVVAVLAYSLMKERSR